MPIDYSEYHPKWRLISYLIRVVRAKGRCEKCGIRNYSIIDKRDRRRPSPDQWIMFNDLLKRDYSRAQAMRSMGFTKIILTVAHIDHDKTNNRFENLAAWCQKCHLTHDIKQHVENRKYGRYHKRGQYKLNLEDNGI